MLNIGAVADVSLRGRRAGVLFCKVRRSPVNVLLASMTGWEIVALVAIIFLLLAASRWPRRQSFLEPKKAEEQKLKKDQTKTEFI
jgi:hypothetical protein